MRRCARCIFCSDLYTQEKKSPPTQSSIVSIKTGPGRYGISILSSGFTPNIDLTTEIVWFQGYCSAHTVGVLWSVQLAQIIKQTKVIETATHTLWGRGMPGAAVDGTSLSSPDQIALAFLRCVDLLMLFC